MTGAPETVHALINAGARLGDKDGNGKTPLHLAVENGHAESARLLVDAGANLNSKDGNGCAPLHLAAQGKLIDVLDGEARDDVIIISEDLPEIARLLIDNGADINAKGRFGATPLHEAASRGHEETTRLLISRGANVNAKDSNRERPLDVAKYPTGDILIYAGAKKGGSGGCAAVLAMLALTAALAIAVSSCG